MSEHMAKVEPATGYRARCSCGWTGPLRSNDLAAEGDLHEHGSRMYEQRQREENPT